ncbi:MAG: gluconeogenesis factor YvcK family protein [Patescibacteria group bacterium]
MSKKKNIVVIGGGTGTYTVLVGLKKYPVDLTAIVSMADDGGSNRVMRDGFGLLPTSDIRQCLVALAEKSDNPGRLLRDLFMYRFHKVKGIKGMTFGNLFIAALTDILGSQEEAIKKTSEILRIKGRVLPVTLDDSRLMAEYENGEKVIGEHLIDEPKPQHDGNLRIKNISLSPKAKVYREARDAILKADMIVIGPGDLYTSLIANFVVDGVAEALEQAKAAGAKVVYVLNLMTRWGQTHTFTAKDHIGVLEEYIGANTLDVVLVNSSPLPTNILKKYAVEKSYPVSDNLRKKHFRIIRSDLLDGKEVKKSPGDTLQRSYIHHDSNKLAKVLSKL